MDLPTVVFRTPVNTHFARLGGGLAVEKLVDAFYAHMARLPEARSIWSMHTRDHGQVKRVLAAYLTEWMGGPKVYSPQRGEPRLGRVHKPFAIGEAERDAWLRCMDLALAQCCPDDTLRAELRTAFAKVAHHLTRHTTGPAARAVAGSPTSVSTPTHEGDLR
jgi:hemoglobin